ncbi:DinB family protein [Cohnella zeiphila]|uniref:DinB family protein n=1 Tax=Cohnella zeiphila TaxID=2761120 RepID=A0A7X0SLN9_9BACL|nr:DinB family protein [Cohnella zeiphila]MBB6732184.1 DinB family protein [Cohnella zeiphila]
MRERPDSNEFSEFYKGYIVLVPKEEDLLEILRRQGEDMESFLSSLTEEQADFRYAEGKWSLREVIGHVADNERIMSYRLLRIARGDATPLPGYNQDVLMAGAPFARMSLADIAADYAAVRRSTLSLLQALPDEAWLRTGSANNSPLSARAIACVIIGHELHHRNIIRERYLPK